MRFYLYGLYGFHKKASWRFGKVKSLKRILHQNAVNLQCGILSGTPVQSKGENELIESQLIKMEYMEIYIYKLPER